MSGLDLFSIGAWAPFDHIFRLTTYPEEGETVTLDMPIADVDRIYFGDCSANVAAVAARLGLRAGLGMVVGDDFVTRGYKDHLASVDVDLSGVEIRNGERCGHNFIYFDSRGDGFCISHLGVAANQDEWDIPQAQIEQARVVVINEMYSDYTLRAIKTAHAQGVLTAINGMVGTAGDLAPDFLAYADLLFISESELRALLSQLMLEDVRDLQALGPQRIFATLGSRGSRVYDGNVQHEIGPIQARLVADTTGAGDSYAAGSLSALLRGYTIQDAACIGAATSSFVIEAWGCQTNLPTWEQVLERSKLNARH